MACQLTTNVVPDLKLQMSKKIAQLTKVICQLNTQNEDYEFDMQELSDQYESEIEQILKDTTEKVNVFKQQLEDKQEEMKALEMAKVLEEQHRKEKQRLLSELDNLQKRHEERERSTQGAASKEIKLLSKDIKKLKLELEERSKVVDDLRQKFLDQEKEYHRSIERKETEVEEAIQTGNEKYSKMLGERLDMEDALNVKLRRLELDLQTKRSESEGLVADLSAGKRLLESQISQAEEIHRESELRWKDQMSRILAQLGQEKESCNSQKIRADDAEEQFRLTADKLRELSIQKTVADNGVEDLENALGCTKDELKRRTDELKQLREQEAITEADLDGHKNQIQEMTDRLRKMTDQSQDLTQAWSVDKENWESKIGEVQGEKLQLEQQLSMIQMDSMETKGCLLEKSKELEEVQQKLMDRKNELDQLKVAWESDKTSGRSSLARAKEDARRALRDVEADLMDSHEEIKSLKQQLEATKTGLERSASQALHKMEEDMTFQLAKAREEHAAAIDTLCRKHEDIQAELCLNAKTTKEELEKVLCSTQAELKDLKVEKERLQKEHDAITTGLRSTMSERGRELEEEINGMREKIAKLERQVWDRDNCVQALESQLESASKNLEAVQEKLAERELDMQVSQKDASAIQRSLEELLERQKEQQSRDEGAFKHRIAELEADIEELRQQHVDAERLIEAYDGKLSQQEREWKVYCEQQLEEAVSKERSIHAQELETMRLGILEESKLRENMVSEKLLQNNMAHVARLTREIEGLRDKHSASLKEMKEAFEMEKVHLGEKRQRELRSLREKHMSELGAREEQIREEMRKALKDLEQLHSEEASHLQSCCKEAEESLKHDLQQEKESHSKMLHDIEQSWIAKQEAESKQLSDGHKAIVEKMKSSHMATRESERRKWTHENSQLRQSVSKLEGSVTKLEQLNSSHITSKKELEALLAETRQSLIKKTQDMTETVHHLMQESQRDKMHLESKHRKRTEEMEDSHSLQISRLEEEFDLILTDEKKSKQQISERFSALKQRFDNREPRREDIEMIQNLEAALMEKDVEAKRNAEQMTQLRNEMLLREDNYNKHFRNGGQAEKVLDVKGAMASTKGLTKWLIQSKTRPQQISGKARARRETD